MHRGSFMKSRDFGGIYWGWVIICLGMSSKQMGIFSKLKTGNFVEIHQKYTKFSLPILLIVFYSWRSSQCSYLFQIMHKGVKFTIVVTDWIDELLRGAIAPLNLHQQCKCFSKVTFFLSKTCKMFFWFRKYHFKVNMMIICEVVVI